MMMSQVGCLTVADFSLKNNLLMSLFISVSLLHRLINQFGAEVMFGWFGVLMCGSSRDCLQWVSISMVSNENKHTLTVVRGIVRVANRSNS